MSTFIDIVTEKCPVCGKGHVFAKKGNPLLFRMPRMETNCTVCGHKFEREPGYFFGSMFVSYAIAVAEMIAVFVIMQFFTTDFATLVTTIAICSVLLSTFNFRMSRMLWIYMFDGGKRREVKS
jgi:uncharacterized protein (DUF983 family)